MSTADRHATYPTHSNSREQLDDAAKKIATKATIGRSSLVKVSFVSSNPSECILVYARGDFFSCAQIDLRKARERELATLDGKSTSSGIAVPYARQKLKARTGWEKKRQHL